MNHKLVKIPTTAFENSCCLTTHLCLSHQVQSKNTVHSILHKAQVSWFFKCCISCPVSNQIMNLPPQLGWHLLTCAAPLSSSSSRSSMDAAWISAGSMRMLALLAKSSGLKKTRSVTHLCCSKKFDLFRNVTCDDYWSDVFAAFCFSCFSLLFFVFSL